MWHQQCHDGTEDDDIYRDEESDPAEDTSDGEIEEDDTAETDSDDDEFLNFCDA